MRLISLAPLALAALGGLLNCTIAVAQCSSPFDVECDTYLTYDVADNYVWGYSYTWDYMDEGYECSVYAEFSTPSGDYFPYDPDDEGYAEVDYFAAGDGSYSATADHRVNDAPNGNTYESATASQPAPTGENTHFDYWDDEYGNFYAVLTGSSTYEGQSLREQDAGGGSDGCSFDGSGKDPFVALTGGTWTVTAENDWGDDSISYGGDLIAYYRANGMLPCSNTLNQNMQIQMSSGWQTCQSNVLHAGIGTTTVSSSRAGVYEEETY